MSDDNLNNESSNKAVEALRVKYAQLCTKYGSVQYQIAVLKRDAAMLEEQLSRINEEAAQLSLQEVK